MQRQYVEAVIQILAELPAGTEFGQIELGRADHPHIEIDLLVAADPTETAVLQKAQQLGLQPRAHLADAIEKQRAAGGQFQQAELAFRARALEGTGAVAEQLGLGHRLRQAGAVERHERRLPARAGQMTGARQQLLASAGLAFDQQRRIEWRHAPRLAHHRGHHFRALEDAVEAAQLLLAHLIDAFADPIGAMQGQHRAGQRLAVVVFGLQRGDVGEEHVALDLHPQAVDPRLVGAHQLGQVEVLGVARQAHARHLVDAHAEQLGGGAVGGDDGAAHVDRQHGKLQRTEQRIELQRMPLTGHQADLAQLEHAGQRLDLRSQRLQLQVHQVGAVQVDGVALLAADLAAGDIDAVVDQQVEHVAQDADAVLAKDLDTHGEALLFCCGAGGASFEHRKFPSRLFARQAAWQCRRSGSWRKRQIFLTDNAGHRATLRHSGTRRGYVFAFE